MPEIFHLIEAGIVRVFDRVIILSIAAELQPNTTAGLMLVENLSAKRTGQAREDANGRLVMFERTPHSVVDETLSEIKQLAAV